MAKQVVWIVGARGLLLAFFFSAPCNLSSRVMLRSSAAGFVVLNFKIFTKFISYFKCKQKINSRHDENFDICVSVASIAISKKNMTNLTAADTAVGFAMHFAEPVWPSRKCAPAGHVSTTGPRWSPGLG